MTKVVNMIQRAADIVIAYVTHNRVHSSDLPTILKNVYTALTNVSQPQEPDRPATRSVTAAQIRRTISDEYLISLEDGRRYKTLRRHLGRLGLTPETYKHKWGLPADYPMVAPNYSAKRATLAKAKGLGRKRISGSSTIQPASETADAEPSIGGERHDGKVSSGQTLPVVQF